MLDFFRLPKDGFHYRRLVEAFKRVFGATIFFGTEAQSDTKAVIDWARFHFLDHMKLWYSTGSQCSGSQTELQENMITLSEVFYSEIDRHRIPVEREVISSLAHAPGILDFYLWLAWKSWTVNGRPVQIQLAGPGGLSQQLGTREYSRNRRFRGKLVSWLKQIRAFWPECPASISACGRFLLIQSSKRSPAIKPA
jgi:hypothetical protein